MKGLDGATWPCPKNDARTSKFILGARAPSPAPACATRFILKKVNPGNRFALRAHSGRGRPRSQYGRARSRLDRLFGQSR